MKFLNKYTPVMKKYLRANSPEFKTSRITFIKGEKGIL